MIPRGETMMLRLLQITVAAIALGLGAPALADDFYAGKTITLMVGNTAGGGYDIYARLLARHMGRHIPGNPAIVVRNQPGAGGKVLANELYSRTPRDGLTFGMLARDNPLEPLFGHGNARFKSEDFTWIGTMSSYEDDAYCLVIRTESPVKSIADARKPGPPLVFGGLQFGETSADIILIAKALFGLNARLIVGYPGTPDVTLALQRGELDGRVIGFSSLQTTMQDWLKAGRLRFLVQFGRETRWRNLPDVPTARELVTSKEDLELLALAEAPFRIARPFVAPPALPADRAAILRKAFLDANRDPELLKEAAAMKIDISPLSGQDTHAIIVGLAHTPAAVIARYKAILAAH